MATAHAWQLHGGIMGKENGLLAGHVVWQVKLTSWWRRARVDLEQKVVSGLAEIAVS